MGYDFSILATRLKKQGLDLTEDAAAAVCTEIVQWVGEEAAKTPGQLDDMMAAAAKFMEPQLKKMIDKIDGKVG